jgi:metallophosphoesterase superfamily enzyme
VATSACDLECVLIRGNHDRRAGALPGSRIAIETVAEPYCVGPFALCHDCDARGAADRALHVIGGHVHPVFELKGKAHHSLRLPCFVTNANATLLPSFGDFTGGYDVRAGAADRVFVTDGSMIWA